MITNALITGTISAPTRAFVASASGGTVSPSNPGQESAITTMIFCNVGEPNITNEAVNSADISLYLVKQGAVPDTTNFSNMIVNRLTVPAGETVFFSDERLILSGGDSVFVGASAPNLVTITVSSLPV